MKSVKSQILPLPYEDINTDLIIPAKYLTTIVKHGLGEHLFTDMRKMDPAFPMNHKKYDQAKIIVTRRNFGCGSSREHAAWSIVDKGIQVVIAPSFADIFYSNAVKNQLLPVVLDAETIEHIFVAEKQCAGYIIDVDLVRQKITLPDQTSYSFEINGYDKHALINEIDNLDYLLTQLEKIKAFNERHRAYIFLDTQALYQNH
jgi:3-isopropylmalate/(R)-2-methylmalate dehydratase small subunit